jgi:hypothetical protein
MMDTILIATLTVLAGKWQQQADSDMVTASAKGRRQVEVLQGCQGTRRGRARRQEESEEEVIDTRPRLQAIM